MARFDDIDKFVNELMDEFLRLCNYNDYGKINLLTISETVDRIYGRCINDMLDERDNAPTADVTETVHAYWIENEDDFWVMCSECGDELLDDVVGAVEAYKYCPFCGAKMDGKEQT